MDLKINICLIIILVLACSPLSQGQSDSLPSDQLEVMKRFRANLEKNQKVMSSPIPPPVDTAHRTYTYDFRIIPTELPDEQAKFEYDALKVDELYDPFHGIIKLGYGLPDQPFGLISYGENHPAEYQWNAYAQHHSMGREGTFQDYSSTFGGVRGAFKINDDWALSGHLYAARRRHQYTPLNADTLYEESDVDRTLLSLTPEFGITGYTGFWTHMATLKYNFDKDNAGPRQKNAVVDISTQRSFNDRGTFRAALSGQLGEISQDTSETPINYASLHISWDQSWGKWSTRLGIKAVSGSSLKVFPDIQLGLILDDQRAHLRLFATGDAQPLTLKNALSDNPFVDPDSELRVLQGSYDFGAALSGRIAGLSYEVSGSYNQIFGQHFFLNDSLERHLFDIVIDDMDQWRLFASIEMNLGDNSRLGIEGEKLILDLKNQEKPWHFPSYNFLIFTSYQLFNESLLIKPALRMSEGGSFIEGNIANKLDPVIDLDLDIRYRINQSWSIFAEGSNLLDQKNPRFYGYDSLGATLLAGIMYKL